LQLNEIPLAVVLACWGAVVALLVCCQAFLQSSFKRLRDSHREVWKQLGEPHILGDPRTFYPARRFLWSELSRSLGDDVLTRRSRLAYLCGMTAAVLGLMLIGTVAALAILRTSSAT